MKRVIFVDDEPRILDGLKRMLRVNRREWDMVFADGGDAALKAFAEAPFDVIVSDMRMPGMDGAELLARVRDEYPDTVRIVLSGFAELEAALRAVPVAHQFLNKPCDAPTIKEVVDRACELHKLLTDDVIRSVVGKVESLPALPKVYAKLMKALADPDVSIKDVTNTIEEDVGMATKILQTANSGFFGVRQTITSVQHATNYLGLDTVKNLALAVEVFRAYEGCPGIKTFSLVAHQAHAIFVANLVSRIVGKTHKDDGFLAGLLHDVGKLILATEMTEYFSELIGSSAESGVPLYEVEYERKSVSHAEIGAYLLGLWGMPYSLVEAVANHHAPARIEQREFGILGAVHVANALANTIQPCAQTVAADSEVDMDYLESLGVAGKLDGWRSIAEEMSGSGEKLGVT